MDFIKDRAMRTLRWLPLVAVCLVCACAGTEPRPEVPVQPPPAGASAVREESLFSFSAEDTNAFTRGLDLLEGRGSSPEPGRAREVFAELMTNYPRSKWRDPAAAFVRLLDEQARLGEAALKDARALEQARREIDQLKREIRALGDRFQEETARLAQENEQLKKDLKLLKELELQMDKRDRELR
jgi:hypothetical protein